MTNVQGQVGEIECTGDKSSRRMIFTVGTNGGLELYNNVDQDADPLWTALANLLVNAYAHKWIIEVRGSTNSTINAIQIIKR